MASPIPLPPPEMRITLSVSCRSTRATLQSVKSHGIAAKNFFLISGRKCADVILDQLRYLHIRCGQKAHRPIRAEHYSIGAEGFEHNVEIGRKFVRAPRFPVRLGDQARGLAV